MSTSSTTKRKKVTTLRACNKDDTCPFHIHIFCHTANNKWYIKYQTEKCNVVKVGVHYGHLQIKSDHTLNKIGHMEPALHTFIKKYLKEQQSPSMILNLFFTQYNIVLPDRLH